MRKIDSTKIKSGGAALSDLKGLEKLTRLREFLTDTSYELDGKTEEREPGTVYFQCRDGVLLVTLKEPSQALLMRLEASSLAMLWPTIEAALDGGTSLWEGDPWARARRKGKKK